MKLKRENLLEFASRDRNKSLEQRINHWQSLSISQRFLLSEALREHMEKYALNWNSEASRREDLLCHVRVSIALSSIKSLVKK